jgi:hypothetical protein
MSCDGDSYADELEEQRRQQQQQMSYEAEIIEHATTQHQQRLHKYRNSSSVPTPQPAFATPYVFHAHEFSTRLNRKMAPSRAGR